MILMLLQGRTQLEDTMDYGGVTGDPDFAFEPRGLVPFKGDDSCLKNRRNKRKVILYKSSWHDSKMALKGAFLRVIT